MLLGTARNRVRGYNVSIPLFCSRLFRCRLLLSIYRLATSQGEHAFSSMSMDVVSAGRTLFLESEPGSVALFVVCANQVCNKEPEQQPEKESCVTFAQQHTQRRVSRSTASHTYPRAPPTHFFSSLRTLRAAMRTPHHSRTRRKHPHSYLFTFLTLQHRTHATSLTEIELMAANSLHRPVTDLLETAYANVVQTGLFLTS